MAIELIGAGLPRTATTTQKMALNILGLPCYHMNEMMADTKKGRRDLAPRVRRQGAVGRGLRGLRVDRRPAGRCRTRGTRRRS